MLCYKCGKPADADMAWPDGYVEGVEVFLCQDCHEADVDQAWWETLEEIWAGTHAPGVRKPWEGKTSEDMEREEVGSNDLPF